MTNPIIEFIASDKLEIPVLYSSNHADFLKDRFPLEYAEYMNSESAPDGDIYLKADFANMPLQIFSQELRIQEAKHMDPISTAVIKATSLLKEEIRNNELIPITDIDSEGNKITKFQKEYVGDDKKYTLIALVDENSKIKTFYIYKMQKGQNRLLVVDISTNYLALHRPITDDICSSKTTIQTEIFEMLGYIKTKSKSQKEMK